ncbi:MAG TPA: putative molybdenum carrier protein [Candidatus Hydrogenedentes bacterium]|nr:putative molybdenum carrier protein [Candidatus Hydrogenedentota bacterium]
MIERVHSGGQTGVDRAALDVAMRLGILCGGWCPKGRLAEDGPIPFSYPLRETPTSDYADRTLWNVRDTDGTLILTHGEPMGGTALTRVFALKEQKPHLVVDLAAEPRVETVRAWLRAHAVRVLNVAGPRTSTIPGIYDLACAFLETLLREEQEDRVSPPPA